MSKSQRVKGAAWERAVANLFAAMWPNAARGIGQARSGSEVPDVQGTPFWVEAKHRKRQCALAALQQAERARRPGYVAALAVIKIDREKPYVAMWLDEFLDILEAMHFSEESTCSGTRDCVTSVTEVSDEQ